MPPYITDNHSSNDWVVPFGNPGINGHLHLNRAYRSLSRPSSPPRAKASTGRPSLLFFRSELYFQLCSTLLFWLCIMWNCLLYSIRKKFTLTKFVQHVNDRSSIFRNLSEGYGLEPFSVDRLFLLVWNRAPGWGNTGFFRCKRFPAFLHGFLYLQVVPGRVELPTSTLSV